MRYLPLFLLCFAPALFAKQIIAPIQKDYDWKKIAERCLQKDAPSVFAEDFNFSSFTATDGNSWFANRKEMKKRYNSLYRSAKRPFGRVYYDQNSEQFLIPLSQNSWDNDDQNVPLPKHFIENLTLHIEEALERGYAEFIFFPDMGHNHFFVTQEYFDQAVKDLDDRQKTYQALFASPDLRMLYHTAEKLKVEDGEGPLDPIKYRRFRYNYRNIFGSYNHQGYLEVFHQNDEEYNTVRSYKDYTSYSAGVYFHASRNGCFPFKDGLRTRYYDITLQYFPYEKPIDSYE